MVRHDMLVTVPVVSRLIGSQVCRALALTLTLARALTLTHRPRLFSRMHGSLR